MNDFDRRQSRMILDAISDFRQSRDPDEMWSHVHKSLAPFGVGGLWYGFEMMPQSGSYWRDHKSGLMLESLRSGYVEAKIATGMADADFYYQAAKCNPAPIIWGDLSLSDDADEQERRSFEVDCDFGILTGATLPASFADGFGASAFSVHTPDLSFAGFDRMWRENGEAIRQIACAFDICMREDHMPDFFPLSPREQEILLRLTEGLRPQQIAFLLSLHEGTVEKHIESARRKLKAATVTQAVATALIFGLIAP
ncbi:helix-turn-helix transcriptional regulator [Magnetospirillum gryphiswaldense]|uniref:Regulatory protein, LuxR n=1 Tax=Magnetospirillum gryphiswaldense TaxID=55518 RepID=A4U0F1_9PROT|nr:helix-turn-helix transcriptional regulator [Magnetospirillum gryphiswaldense]AVM73376.1 DNA-binding transcriptional activator SdiA [Magnetospirillum gryphiswaldense MSR-1]AVM77279.1 DNA-binding transcriptional activator SdiA [Magnetospirillum gryphiswaldense]CAM76358.1 regulatory protein, LuxR [Magnetospirillum gryphiswaldense MSR-1]